MLHRSAPHGRRLTYNRPDECRTALPALAPLPPTSNVATNPTTSTRSLFAGAPHKHQLPNHSTPQQTNRERNVTAVIDAQNIQNRCRRSQAVATGTLYSVLRQVFLAIGLTAIDASVLTPFPFDDTISSSGLGSHWYIGRAFFVSDEAEHE